MWGEGLWLLLLLGRVRGLPGVLWWPRWMWGVRLLLLLLLGRVLRGLPGVLWWPRWMLLSGVKGPGPGTRGGMRGGMRDGTRAPGVRGKVRSQAPGMQW